MKVQVLLKDDVEHVGKTGDLVRVAAGYARNYLIPNRLATAVNASTLQEIEALKKRKAVREMEQKREFAGVADRINGVALTIAMRVTETGTLYGAVHDHTLAELLKAKGIDVPVKMFQMDEPLKTLGSHAVTIKLHPEVLATLKVTVAANNETPVTAAELEAEAKGDEDDDDFDRDE